MENKEEKPEERIEERLNEKEKILKSNIYQIIIPLPIPSIENAFDSDKFSVKKVEGENIYLLQIK